MSVSVTVSGFGNFSRGSFSSRLGSLSSLPLVGMTGLCYLDSSNTFLSRAYLRNLFIGDVCADELAEQMFEVQRSSDLRKRD